MDPSSHRFVICCSESGTYGACDGQREEVCDSQREEACDSQKEERLAGGGVGVRLEWGRGLFGLSMLHPWQARSRSTFSHLTEPLG